MIVALLIACGGPTPDPVEPRFVRAGVWDGEQLQRVDWTPGQQVHGVEAPRIAECIELARVPLGDLSARIAAGIPSPDTDLAWGPDGSLLAVGTYLGEVLVLDGWTGAVRARRTLAESAVKRVLWSADGSELYAAQLTSGASRHSPPRHACHGALTRSGDAAESRAISPPASPPTSADAPATHIPSSSTYQSAASAVGLVSVRTRT